MNKINKLIIITLLLINSAINSQNKYSEKIIKSGKVIARAMVEKNYEKIVDLTYPKIIKLVGGKEQMINIIRNGIKQMENQGIKYSSVEIGKPQEIYKAGNEFHCLVPQKITMTNRNGKVINDSYLLAISKNDGENWSFLDTSQLTNENATELFPEFNKNLNIPEKTKPIFKTN
jgi:hypothetical protein